MSGVQGLQGRNGMPSYTQGNNDKSFTNEKLEKRFPFWRERGNDDKPANKNQVLFIVRRNYRSSKFGRT